MRWNVSPSGSGPAAEVSAIQRLEATLNNAAAAAVAAAEVAAEAAAAEAEAAAASEAAASEVLRWGDPQQFISLPSNSSGAIKNAPPSEWMNSSSLAQLCGLLWMQPDWKTP